MYASYVFVVRCVHTLNASCVFFSVFHMFPSVLRLFSIFFLVTLRNSLFKLFYFSFYSYCTIFLVLSGFWRRAQIFADTTVQ